MKGIIRFRKIWLWVFFIGFVLFLLSSNSGSRPIWNPLEQLIIEATAPFQKLVTKTVIITRNFWLDYFNLVDVRRQNRRLKRKNNALRMENNRYRELLATHQRLQGLGIHFPTRTPCLSIPAVDGVVNNPSVVLKGNGQKISSKKSLPWPTGARGEALMQRFAVPLARATRYWAFRSRKSTIGPITSL